MGTRLIEKRSPRILWITGCPGMDTIQLKVGKHKMTVQVSNSAVYVNVGSKKIHCVQRGNVVDVTVDESK